MKSYKIVCLTMLLALASCQEKKQEKPSPTYKTITVELTSDTLNTRYSASMTGREIVEVRPQVNGLITKILIQEGQTVRKGQTLFIIDQVPYQAAVNTAEAALASAKASEATAQINYDAKKQLHDQQVLGDFDLQTAHQSLLQARAQVSQAQAQLTNARNSLSYTVVKSPVDGVAGMIPYHVGALVGSNIAEPLVTVSDDREMLVYFSISEREATDWVIQYGSVEAFLQKMPAVHLFLANGSQYEQEGRVDAVSGIVDSQTGSVSLRASFPNDRHLLKNGGSCMVELQARHDSVIVIPQSATYELQNRVFAYRVVDDKAQSTPITVNKLNDGKRYIVESGLSAGDVIIAEGAGLIRDGEEVK